MATLNQSLQITHDPPSLSKAHYLKVSLALSYILSL